MVRKGRTINHPWGGHGLSFFQNYLEERTFLGHFLAQFFFSTFIMGPTGALGLVGFSILFSFLAQFVFVNLVALAQFFF